MLSRLEPLAFEEAVEGALADAAVDADCFGAFFLLELGSKGRRAAFDSGLDSCGSADIAQFSLSLGCPDG